MRLSDFYQQAIRLASQCDPRGRGRIFSYPDSRILYGHPDTKVKRILVGIDIEVAELLLADRLRQRQGLDLVLAHHPQGKAYASLSEVMRLQIDILRQVGVTKKVSAELLEERMREVERRILSQNHTRPEDAARILELPFICLHTPADNYAFCFVRNLLERKKPKKVQDILDILKEVPEYKEAVVGPRIILGNPRRPVGKILVEMTGGTEGSREVFDKLYKAGVRTLVSMHLSEEHFKKAREANLNAIIAGHISSDTLGLNLLLDRIQQKGGEEFDTISCSGFRRIKRK
jgi:putative NIF3 family GTP cyclohydrolase 1 type 2